MYHAEAISDADRQRRRAHQTCLPAQPPRHQQVAALGDADQGHARQPLGQDGQAQDQAQQQGASQRGPPRRRALRLPSRGAWPA